MSYKICKCDTAAYADGNTTFKCGFSMDQVTEALKSSIYHMKTYTYYMKTVADKFNLLR